MPGSGPGMTTKHKRPRLLLQATAASNGSLALLAVADAIDRTGPVVGNEDRSVLGDHDIRRAAEITLITLDPAFRKDLLLSVLAVRPDDHALDTRALILGPVPGAVLSDQDVVLVLGRELVASIELHAERRDMGAELGGRGRELLALVPHREFRIGHVTLMAVGIAEMLADLRDHVELVARHVVADPVAGVFGEPVAAGARIDVAADAVADAKRPDFG